MVNRSSIITRKIFTASEIKSLEGEIVSLGASPDKLIDLASTFIARTVLRYSPPFSKVIGLIGKGNNGRDGGSTLLKLFRHGKRFGVVTLSNGSFSSLPEASEVKKKADFVAFINNGIKEVLEYFENYRPQLVLDGIFGIGYKPPLSEELRKLFSFINEKQYFNVAIDIPTGVVADTGEADEDAFQADITASFFGLKPAHLVYPAKLYCGEVLVSALGFDFLVSSYQTKSFLVDEETLKQLLPVRSPTAHKKSSKVLVVAGSERMPGASVLACKAAFAAGAGYVAVASTPGVRNVVISNVPEAVFIPLPEKNGAIAEKAADLILEMENDFDSCLIGCGLSREKEALSAALKVFEKIKLPLVVDGDALFALSLEPIDKGSGERILTPHRGEAERLIGEKATSPSQAAAEISKRFRSVCVYKESVVIISDSGNSFYLPYGTNLLATAGTGDVLSGMIAGMLAQGLSPLESAVSGTLLLQKTSELATDIWSGVPLRASEIIEHVKLAATEICGG